MDLRLLHLGYSPHPMMPSFQEGRRPRANTVASLANTGHVHPLARRPAGGAMQHAHSLGPASRPGPKPLSAQQIMTVNRQNAATQRAAMQTAKRTVDVVQRIKAVPYSEYDPRKKTGWEMTVDSSGATGWERKRVGELWVFSRIIDAWGSREFMVFNPQNGHHVAFVPAGHISAKREIQNIASATGVFGKHAEQFTYATAITLGTGGLGGAAGLTGVGVRAIMGRMVVDATTQFAGGLMAHDLSFKDALEEVNLTSTFLAGLPGGSMLGSFRNNALSSLMEVKADVATRGFKVEYANFMTISGVINYLQKVAIGVGGDYVTGKVNLKLSRVRGAYASAAVRTRDVNMRWIYQHNVRLLILLDRTIEASKSMGEGVSNLLEDELKKYDLPNKTSKKR